MGKRILRKLENFVCIRRVVVHHGGGICILKKNLEIQRIAQFRYIKIQLETKAITTRLRGINHTNPYHHSPKPRSDVFCFKLNFNISKLGYWAISLYTHKRAITWKQSDLMPHTSIGFKKI